MAGNCDFKSLKRQEKPVLHFDNGCKVTFTIEAVEVITGLGAKVRRDVDVVKKVFQWATIKGRMPSFCDVLTMKDLSVSDVFAVYGCWDRFVARLKSLGEDMEFKDMALPAEVSKLSSEQITEFLDQDHGLLEESLRTILIESIRLEAALRQIAENGKYGTLGSAHRERICDAVSQVAKSARLMLDSTRVAVFVMSFDNHASLKSLGPTVDSTLAIRNLSLVTQFRDINRVGIESVQCVTWLRRAMKLDGDRWEASPELFDVLISGHSVLSSVASSYEDIVAQW